ncbi:hypothetical protein ACTI_33470 [Actinoplanes sp. OR16]|nr:hypothetical protein ACTI_33470 [Actinoplanes sp. OR16]
MEATRRDAPPAEPGARTASGEPDERALGLRRQYYKERGADAVPKSSKVPQTRLLAPGMPPSAANVTLDDCRDEDFAYADGGFVIDHYNFCQVTLWDVKVTVCSFSLPLLGCVRRKTLGTASFRRATLGVGWDGSMDSPQTPDPTYSQVSFVTALDQISTTLAGDAIVVEVTLDCNAEQGALCRSHPFERGAKKTVAEWKDGVGTFNRFFSDPADGVGRDKLSWYNFTNRQVVSPMGAGDEDSDEWEGNGYRCDEASYLRGGRGCVFDHVEELFPVSLATTTNYHAAAQHIFEAFHAPDTTFPRTPGKDVAGNLNSSNPRPLSRLYEPYDTTIYNANRRTAVATCQAQWPGYAANGDDCDEYPMAATYQGASQANGHYSAKALNLNQNRSLGATMLVWFTGQRVLHEDHFWVVLTVPDGGGGQGGGSGLPDTAPTVSAGPDVRAYEGTPGTLRGAARDIEGDLSLHWTYEVIDSAKPGMSCTFGNATSAATRITCNDEGTVRATLTADDGVNPPVSDSATVTVVNAPPQLTLEGPEPWQSFRAGTPVDVRAPFTDAGALDTHTCRITWDDGQIADFGAENRTCDQRHTFPHAGMYTITVTVTDDGGASDSATTMVVVYDPDAGFDNADGKFDSPTGAWTQQPAVAAPMDFHLTAKYYNQTAPTGAAGAYLANTNLRFRTTTDTLEWLVVTPDGKVAAKGTGTVDGKPGYGFVYYGYDQPGGDKFRMVLWPLSSGPYPQNTIEYDNRASAGYDIDVAEPQPITNGEVRIHPPVTR